MLKKYQYFGYLDRTELDFWYRVLERSCYQINEMVTKSESHWCNKKLSMKIKGHGISEHVYSYFAIQFKRAPGLQREEKVASMFLVFKNSINFSE